MFAKSDILDKWQLAVAQGCAVAFINTYGWSTAQERYNETQDAFGREDDVRLVKSCNQLMFDMPGTLAASVWPGFNTLLSIANHVLDEDYPSSKRVAQAVRDPNINMYSEAVLPGDRIQAGEPADDMNYEQLTQKDKNDD